MLVNSLTERYLLWATRVESSMERALLSIRNSSGGSASIAIPPSPESLRITTLCNIGASMLCCMGSPLGEILSGGGGTKFGSGYDSIELPSMSGSDKSASSP